MFIKEDNEITEGIVPLNFNWKDGLRTQSVEQDYYNNYNPMVNLNDPMVQHDMELKKQRAAKSQEMQKAQQFRTNAHNVILKCVNSVSQLISGNKHKGFNSQDAHILFNSIRNKCVENLNFNKCLIDNDILLETLDYFIKMYTLQYNQDCIRLSLSESNYIGFNSTTGEVLFNPQGLVEIICEWTNKNRFHNKMGDINIFD